MALREKDAGSAFFEAIAYGVLACVVAFFTVGTIMHLQTGSTADTVAGLMISVAAGTFIGAMAVVLGYYHRRLALGIAGGLLMAALPPATSLTVLYLFGSRVHGPGGYLSAIPAGLVATFLFGLLRGLHFRETRGQTGRSPIS